LLPDFLRDVLAFLKPLEIKAVRDGFVILLQKPLILFRGIKTGHIFADVLEINILIQQAGINRLFSEIHQRIRRFLSEAADMIRQRRCFST